MERNKLYLVTLRGFGGYVTGIDYKSSYVVAKNADEAYHKVRSYLNDKDYGLTAHRELKSVELIADEHEYSDTGTRLFL